MNCCGYIFCIKRADVGTKEKEIESNVLLGDVDDNDGSSNSEVNNTQAISEKICVRNEEKEALSKQLGAVEKETSNLREKVQNEEIERDILQAKLNTIDVCEKAALREKVEAELSEIDSLREQLRTFQEENSKGELKRRISLDEKERDRLQGQVQIYQDEKDEMVEKGNTLKGFVYEIKQKIKMQESEKDSLSKKLTLQVKANSTLRQKIKMAEAEKEKFKKQVEVQDGQNDTIAKGFEQQRSTETLEKEKAELEEKLKKVETENEELHKQIEALQRVEEQSYEKARNKNKEEHVSTEGGTHSVNHKTRQEKESCLPKLQIEPRNEKYTALNEGNIRDIGSPEVREKIEQSDYWYEYYQYKLYSDIIYQNCKEEADEEYRNKLRDSSSA